MSPSPLILDTGGSRLTVSPEDGGRMTSLVVSGQELLVTEGRSAIHWGCYPMVPFAGRIRDGQFTFAGRDIQLRRNLPPHAIHGTVFERTWTIGGPDTLVTDLGPDWPFAGQVRQRFTIGPASLEVELTLEADEPMPGALGWHPWFRRVLTGTVDAPRAASAPVEIAFDAARMYVRGTDGLPTGGLTEPGPGPWDDCFVGLRSSSRLTWPGTLTVEIRSSCTHLVVYDESATGVCLEPQTAPPDFPNIEPMSVLPGAPLRSTMAWRWWPGDGPANAPGDRLEDR